MQYGTIMAMQFDSCNQNIDTSLTHILIIVAINWSSQIKHLLHIDHFQ